MSMNIPPRLFDRALLLARRRRALHGGAETFLLERRKELNRKEWISSCLGVHELSK